MTCCKKLQCYKQVSQASVFHVRQEIYDITSSVDRRFKIDSLLAAPHAFQGKPVCITWLKRALLVSNHKVYRSVVGPSLPRVREDKKAQSVVGWLTLYARWFEFQPDKHEIHLSVPCKKWVWETYMNEVDNTMDASGQPASDVRVF